MRNQTHDMHYISRHSILPIHEDAYECKSLRIYICLSMECDNYLHFHGVFRFFIIIIIWGRGEWGELKFVPKG